jgi:hypothetical protein
MRLGCPRDGQTWSVRSATSVASNDHEYPGEDAAGTTDVAANDSDVDGDLDPASVSVTVVPAHGSAVANGDGTVTYTPDADYHGPDAYSYEICDLETLCTTATVSVVITGVNDPPNAASDHAAANRDGSAVVDVLSNDDDPDGALDPASVQVTGAPGHGTAVVNPDGSITYTPEPGWTGTDAFTYETCDSGAPALRDRGSDDDVAATAAPTPGQTTRP